MGSGEGEGEVDEAAVVERWDVWWDEAARRTAETRTVPSIGTMTFNGQS